MVRKKKPKRGKFGRVKLDRTFRKTVATRKKKSGRFTGRRKTKKGERSKIRGLRRESKAGRILGFSTKKKR